MKHASHVAECPICRQNDPDDGGWPIDVIYEDELWLVHHCYNAQQLPDADGTAHPETMVGGPAPLPGWLLFHSQRHVHGPADFTDEECASFTFAIRHVENKLLEATGALRIYTSLIGETGPHLHAHLIPRYSDERLTEMGVDLSLGSAMGVFDLNRGVGGRTVPAADPVAVERVSAALKEKLAADPIPSVAAMVDKLKDVAKL
jgi:diadenosine tetraphosphate (Ap4A) HIT family hydrolase